MMSNVIHPGHYNIPGRKECIEEMLEKFGYEKTEAFCELNSYKYQYRHEQKNGQEDLDKAANYQDMLQHYQEEDPRFKIAEHFGLADVKLVLDQVIHLMECEDQVQQVMKQKIERTFERIGEQNAGN